MIFFTSDLHLGHEKAITFSQRPFANVEEMNNVLIDNINKTVDKDDELWVLGDFSFKISRDEVREWRNRIICKHVHLVTGNHDRDYSDDHIFQSVQPYKELKTEYGKVILFHYPIWEWSSMHYGTIHLHGHIHSTGDYNKNNLKMKCCDRFSSGHLVKDENLRLRIYDVGVDANEYRPISLEEIAALMNIAKQKQFPAYK